MFLFLNFPPARCKSFGAHPLRSVRKPRFSLWKISFHDIQPQPPQLSQQSPKPLQKQPSLSLPRRADSRLPKLQTLKQPLALSKAVEIKKTRNEVTVMPMAMAMETAILEMGMAMETATATFTAQNAGSTLANPDVRRRASYCRMANLVRSRTTAIPMIRIISILGRTTSHVLTKRS